MLLRLVVAVIVITGVASWASMYVAVAPVDNNDDDGDDAYDDVASNKCCATGITELALLWLLPLTFSCQSQYTCPVLVAMNELASKDVFVL